MFNSEAIGLILVNIKHVFKISKIIYLHMPESVAHKLPKYHQGIVVVASSWFVFKGSRMATQKSLNSLDQKLLNDTISFTRKSHPQTIRQNENFK